MRCPYCHHPDSRVIDSRDVDTGIRRRRECVECKSRFTTYERIEAQALYVIKKDGRREEFDRTKLLSGLRIACAKRPLPIGTVERLVNDVESDLRRLGRTEVASTMVGEMVMERLKVLDHIAYVRFASVYREFTDLETLRREVETLASGRERPSAPNQLPLLPPEPLALGRRRRRPAGQP
ncbi:MAG: transcriptional repressor NrdR [Dehalococcoidia bacterium]|nr:transcriptional repressor NrdR [Dehalococcoidia bacterium]